MYNNERNSVVYCGLSIASLDTMSVPWAHNGKDENVPLEYT